MESQVGQSEATKSITANPVMSLAADWIIAVPVKSVCDQQEFSMWFIIDMMNNSQMAGPRDRYIKIMDYLK